MTFLSITRLEFLISRRNFWVATAILLMVLFAVVLTFAGTAPSGTLGVDPVTLSASSITTLSVYLVPLIGLLLSFDAIAGERERGTLALNLTYPMSRGEVLLGKFLAHLGILALAVAAGLAASALITLFQHGSSDLNFAPFVRLFLTSVALGAAFIGIGYTVSSLVRQPSVASGVVIFIWLICVVLYDLGLLGALVADDGGYFTKTLFPWFLVANPADAFRLLNTPETGVATLTSGLGAAGSVSGVWGQLLSLLAWPAFAFFFAWLSIKKIEL